MQTTMENIISSRAIVDNKNHQKKIAEAISSVIKKNSASDVLRRLLESGKITTEDVARAIEPTTRQPSSSGANDSTSPPPLYQDRKISCTTNPRNQVKLIESEKLRTRHIALQFSYDGTDYSGFAENIGKENDNSVEKSLFAALEKTRLLVNPDEMEMVFLKEGSEGGTGKEFQIHEQNISARNASKYSRCGRTDRGVHAHGQVVALYLKSAFPVSAKKVVGCDTHTPGSPLVEDDLPKNSLDGLECFVPQRKNDIKKKKKTNANEGGNFDTAIQQRDATNDDTDATSSPAVTLKTVHEYDYARMLNNVLPPSIRIMGWCPVSQEFSARFSCSRRTYRYFFPRRDLDLRLMAQGLNHMMGKHDFRNMCKMNCEQVYNFERVLMKGKVVSPQAIYEVAMKEDDEKKTEDASLAENSNERDEIEIKVVDSLTPLSPRDMCHVEITGQAFLWHQIRCIMSILFFIGRKLESPSIVNELVDIQANPAKPAYEMASETALVLHECTFGKLHMGRTVKNLWEVTKTLEQRWERHAVAAERAKNELDSLNIEARVKWSDVMIFVDQIAKEKRRKERKNGSKSGYCGMDSEPVIQNELKKRAPAEMLPWTEAMNAIQDILGVHPYLPTGNSDGGRGLTESSIHVPLMERSKGTTYEEKVKSILTGDNVGRANGNCCHNRKSSKRRERYEENIIKKRKTSEEDKAFYDHMLQQGGSSM
ncbi:hypothetical protein ACHAXS_008216 [Conticribra weissflogii]